MRTYVLAGAAAMVLSIQLVPTHAEAQRAWCEKDCVALCKRTLPPGVTLGQCIEKNRCWSFKGNKCAGKGTVARRAKVYNSRPR